MVLHKRVPAGKGLQRDTRNASGEGAHKAPKLSLRNGAAYSKSIKQECDSYGYGFVLGIQEAFKQQEEENRQEWGLVLVMPVEVKEASKHLGHERFKSRAEENISPGAYRQGYADGKEFDPTRRLKAEAVV